MGGGGGGKKKVKKKKKARKKMEKKYVFKNKGFNYFKFFSQQNIEQKCYDFE